MCNRYWLLGVCALCLGLGIFIVKPPKFLGKVLRKIFKVQA